MTKQHPADLQDAARIADAVSYTVHFIRGPFERYNERADTLAEARQIEARMNADHGQYGRRAMIYAISSDGSATPLS